MNKILIVGELNQLLGSLNQYLSTKFQTQMCVDNLEIVKKTVKIYKLDMVIVCLSGTNELDKRILDYFADRNVKSPVLMVGTAQECDGYQDYFESEQFDFVTRPTTLGMLQQKCEELLKLVKDDDENEIEVVSEQKRKNILVVDDSGILLRSVKAMLDKTYDVAVANSGMTALKQAKRKIPDLILLDYEMPEWDGRKTFEEIRKDDELKNVPVVFLTAVADKAHIAAVFALRPSGYLLKPIEQQVLVDTIEKAMINI